MQRWGRYEDDKRGVTGQHPESGREGHGESQKASLTQYRSSYLRGDRGVKAC